MLLDAQWSIVLIVFAGESLMVVSEDQLITAVDLDVGLTQKHILLTPDLISGDLRHQGRRRRAEVWHVHYLRHIRALTVVSEKEERAILFDWTTEPATKLIDP